MIYIVLGMHKSGTTLISQILHKSGVSMGEFDESISYDKGNQYERHEAQLINRVILECGTSHSLDVITPVEDIASNSLVPELIQNLIVELNEKHEEWGFKDPRTCLNYPVWKKYLPKHKVIYVFRDPLELWHHYRKYIPSWKIFQRTLQGFKALRAWSIYNQLLLKYMSEEDSAHVINFSEFMADDRGITRLSRYVNLSLEDSRKKKLYRNKSKPDFQYNICVKILSILYSYKVKGLLKKLNDAKVQ